MGYIKKYYPMVISILFFGIYSLLAVTVFTDNDSFFDNTSLFMNIFFIFALLLIIVIWAEIIGFMIHAVKNKNGLWALWIYLFNIFVFPYYNLKYVYKEKSVSTQMCVFAFLMFFSIIISVFVVKYGNI